MRIAAAVLLALACLPASGQDKKPINLALGSVTGSSSIYRLSKDFGARQLKAAA